MLTEVSRSNISVSVLLSVSLSLLSNILNSSCEVVSITNTSLVSDLGEEDSMITWGEEWIIWARSRGIPMGSGRSEVVLRSVS